MRGWSTPKRAKITSDNRKLTHPPVMAEELGRVTTGYQHWLTRQPLSVNTRRAYLGRVRQYCAYLAARVNDYGNPLSDPHGRDYAIRDFKSHLKKSCKAKPASVNLTLAALDNLYLFLGLGRANVRREDLPKEAPRALEPEEQKRFMRAVERCTSVRDRALALLLFYTALRIGECVGLNTDDIALSARKGKVTVRAGKGDIYREVALNAEVREALAAWLAERGQRFPNQDQTALFLNSHGQRLSIRSIDLTMRGLGEEAHVAVSAHRLRHSCLTNLVRRGHDLVLVAEIAGHKRIETTRRYSLPTEHDREAAMESLRMGQIGSMIIGSELGIGYDPGQHAAYAASWIKILEHQPLEIFRAAAEGEKIHTYLQGLQQRQSISSEELRTDKSDIIKEYDRLVKNPEARRQLEKQNPGLVAARDQAIVEIRREKLQKETAERQHKVARVRR